MTALARRVAAGRVPLSSVAAMNVRAETARRGILQSDLADGLGMSRMAVSDRFRGRTPWTVDELAMVAEMLGVPLAVLLERSEGTPVEVRATGVPVLLRARRTR